MDRAEHLAGLNLDGLMPVDIDYFFRTLADRVPTRVRDDGMDTLGILRHRIQRLAVDLGNTTAASLDPADVQVMVGTIVGQLSQMKRRHWRGKVGDVRLLDHVRRQVGEISADLRELGVG